MLNFHEDIFRVEGLTLNLFQCKFSKSLLVRVACLSQASLLGVTRNMEDPKDKIALSSNYIPPKIFVLANVFFFFFLYKAN